MSFLESLIETRREQLDMILNSSSIMSDKAQHIIIYALEDAITKLEGVELVTDPEESDWEREQDDASYAFQCYPNGGDS